MAFRVSDSPLDPVLLLAASGPRALLAAAGVEIDPWRTTGFRLEGLFAEVFGPNTQRIVTYPHAIGFEWHQPYRHDRIREVLEASDENFPLLYSRERVEAAAHCSDAKTQESWD